MFDKKEIEKLIKNSANYWEKRALSSKLNIMENEEDYLKRITSIYDEARRQIDDKLAATYGRYGKENKLTLKEAYKKLPSAIEKEYKNDVDDYIKKAESGDPKWRQYLLNQSIMHKHTVLNQLQTEYRKVIYDIDMEETGGLFLEKIFTNSNYQNQFARYQAGYDDPFAKVDKTKIKNLIEQDWVGGEGFSNRIWKNKQLLIDSLDDIVIKGLATGTSIDKMSNELAKKMDTAVSNAKRLIMTESARMDNEALLDRYKTTGEKQLQFVATLDMKTSEICRIMDGTIINIDDAQIGLNVPPLHPYCRSVMIAYHPEMGEIEERAYRDTETGKTKMGSYKNYGDYLVGELNDKKQAEALISTRNDLKTLIMAAGTTSVKTQTSTVPDKTIKDITGYDVNEKHMDWVINRNSEELETARLENNLTEEDLEKVFKDIKETFESDAVEVAIRVSEDALKDILKSGKITNGFEIDKIHNFIEKHRLRAEKNLFNIPLEAKASSRPVYGYLSNKDLEMGMTGVKVAMYGDIKVILKDNVRDRSTFTMGDSLDRESMIFPSKLKDIKMYSFEGYDLIDIKDGGLRTFYSYPEVQIFGDIKLKDIKYIQLPKTLKNSGIVKSIKKKGIKIKYE